MPVVAVPTGDVAGALALARQRLAAAGQPAAPLEARMLVGHVLGIAADDVIAAGGRPFTATDGDALAALVARRLAGEPMAYILGRREFWSLRFRCDARTLIPRPDSETLIEAALARRPDRRQPLRVLDLGTGSGCLLLTVLHLYPAAWGVGIDRSAGALAVAADNARRLGLAARAAFVAGDWLTSVAGRFDLVLANPPYVSEADLAALPPGIRDWEPRLALDGGGDGLDSYRAILPALPPRLAAGGLALIEIGAGQAPAVAALAGRAGLQHVDVARDLAGIDRCLAIGWAEPSTPKKNLGRQTVPV